MGSVVLSGVSGGMGSALARKLTLERIFAALPDSAFDIY